MAKPFYFFFLFTIFIIHSPTNSFVECAKNIYTDQTALIDLKRQLTLADPNNVLACNWSTAVSVCHWIGVTCGLHHHRVVALNISNMGLSGQLPASLGNLSFLSLLDMSHNKFHGRLPKELAYLNRLKLLYMSTNNLTGEIPQQLGNLHQLKVINMHVNQFVGSIPSSIFNISTLEHIDLSSNSLSGTLPSNICHNLPNLKGLYLGLNSFSGTLPVNLSECSKLRVLGLEDNKFSGSIPREIGKLEMLVEITLYDNNLTGMIPQEISNLNELELLYLRDNNLSGLIPRGLFNMTALRVIEISVNQLWGSLPYTIGQGLPNLEELYISETKLSGVIPPTIANCSQLSIIALSINYLTGSIPHSLGDLRFLLRLELAENNLSNEFPFQELSFITSLTKCKDLYALDVDTNFLNGILPKSIGNFSSSLGYLLLSNTGLSGRVPEEIGNLSGLETLDMSLNNLSGIIPHTLIGFQWLERFQLYGNKLGGPLPNSLCKLKKLGKIDLGINQISGPIPECLVNLTFLRYIYLDSNRITGRLPSSLWIMKDLLELNLSSNSLSGALSPNIENLKVITSIWLSKNQLSGSIPRTIGSLQNLMSLSLAQNNLNGEIPESIGGLISLELLDLSHNNFTGLIPKSLQNIRQLVHFNVSFNQLRGEIPSNGPFRNFTNLSFLFNKALCGAPKFHVPQCQRSNAKIVHHYIYLAALGIIAGILALTGGLVLIICRKKMKFVKQEDIFVVKTVEKVTYYELLHATNGYSESNMLGAGSFGVVYKAILNNGRNVAVKVFKMQQEEFHSTFDAECKVWCNIRHRNLTKVLSCCSNPDFKALVLEYMPNGSFEKWLYSENCFLDMMRRLNIMIDVACALEYLHHDCPTPVVHCDLKPCNVLLDENMVAHVSDFGIAKLLSSDDGIVYTRTLATLGYIAPEYGYDGLVSTRCDVYSYGIMLMETFTRKKPNSQMFCGNITLQSWVKESLPDRVIDVIDSNLVALNEENFSEKVKCLSSIMELALCCSANSPVERISMKDVLVALQKIKRLFLTQ